MFLSFSRVLFSFRLMLSCWTGMLFSLAGALFTFLDTLWSFGFDLYIKVAARWRGRLFVLLFMQGEFVVPGVDGSWWCAFSVESQLAEYDAGGGF